MADTEISNWPVDNAWVSDFLENQHALPLMQALLHLARYDFHDILLLVRFDCGQLRLEFAFLFYCKP